MRKYVFRLNVEADVSGVEIMADSYDDAMIELQGMTVDELLRNGYVENSNFEDIEEEPQPTHDETIYRVISDKYGDETFDDPDSALEIAKDYAEDDSSVIIDEVEVAMNEDDEIIDEYDRRTIWTANDDDDDFNY